MSTLAIPEYFPTGVQFQSADFGRGTFAGAQVRLRQYHALR